MSRAAQFLGHWKAMLHSALAAKLAPPVHKQLGLDGLPKVPLRRPEDIVIRSRSRYWPNEEDRKHAANEAAHAARRARA